jgi:hypothetical protein
MQSRRQGGVLRAALDLSISDCEFVVITLRSGKFELGGVDFQFLETVKPFSFFQSPMLTLRHHESLAAMWLSIFPANTTWWPTR